MRDCLHSAAGFVAVVVHGGDGGGCGGRQQQQGECRAYGCVDNRSLKGAPCGDGGAFPSPYLPLCPIPRPGGRHWAGEEQPANHWIGDSLWLVSNGAMQPTLTRSSRTSSSTQVQRDESIDPQSSRSRGRRHDAAKKQAKELDHLNRGYASQMQVCPSSSLLPLLIQLLPSLSSPPSVSPT